MHPKTIEYREQRAQRNAGMPTAYQLAEAQRQHDIMNNLIKALAKSLLVRPIGPCRVHVDEKLSFT